MTNAITLHTTVVPRFISHQAQPTSNNFLFTKKISELFQKYVVPYIKPALPYLTPFFTTKLILCWCIPLALLILTGIIIKHRHKFIYAASYIFTLLTIKIREFLSTFLPVKKWNSFDEILDEDGQPTGIIVGRQPCHLMGDEVTLKKLNVTTVIDCTETHETSSLFRPITKSDYDHFYNNTLGKTISYTRLETPDFAPVPLSKIKQALQIIAQHKQRMQSNEKILIHCKAGKGRSATIATAYFVQKKAVENKNASNIVSSACLLVQNSRKQIHLNPKQRAPIIELLG